MEMRRVVTSDRDRPGEAQDGRLRRVGARPALLVGGDVGGEYAQGAPHEIHRAIRVPACTAPADFVQPPMQAPHETVVPVAPRQAGQIVGDGGKPEHAGSALSGTLAGQETGDPCRLGNAARFWPQHDDDPDTGRGTDGPQRQRGVRRGEIPRADPGATVTTDQQRLGAVRRGDSGRRCRAAGCRGRPRPRRVAPPLR